MTAMTMHRVDAFTDRPFAGNPARRICGPFPDGAPHVARNFENDFVELPSSDAVRAHVPHPATIARLPPVGLAITAGGPIRAGRSISCRAISRPVRALTRIR